MRAALDPNAHEFKMAKMAVLNKISFILFIVLDFNNTVLYSRGSLLLPVLELLCSKLYTYVSLGSLHTEGAAAVAEIRVQAISIHRSTGILHT